MFIAEILGEFNLLTAILNKKFINYDYLGGLFEAFSLRNFPKTMKKLLENS